MGYTGPVWRREWVIYHNNQKLRHQRVSVHQGDFFACYERGDCTPILQDEHMTTDIAQGWVANSPSPLPGDVADSAPVVPTVSVDARNDTSFLLSKLLGIRYSSLEDGGVAASRMIGLSLLIWMLFSKQVLSIHLPRHSRQKSRQKRGFAALFNTLFHKGASFSCLSVHCIDIVYLLTMHAAGYMHSPFLMLFSYLTLA